MKSVHAALMNPATSWNVPAVAMPEEITFGWGYLVICAVFFALCGLICGYFIWRKGNMQMHDAELEVEKTAAELQALRTDLDEEEKGIRLEDENSEVEKIVPSAD